MWLKYSENKPEKSGYYMTYYFHPEVKCDFYKAIWFSVEKNTWISWKYNPSWQPEVLGYIPESRNDYYCPCLSWCEENNIPNFEK